MDHGRNDNTLGEIKMYLVEKKLAQRKQKWWNRVSRVEDIIYPKQIINYRPI